MDDSKEGNSFTKYLDRSLDLVLASTYPDDAGYALLGTCRELWGSAMLRTALRSGATRKPSLRHIATHCRDAASVDRMLFFIKPADRFKTIEELIRLAVCRRNYVLVLALERELGEAGGARITAAAKGDGRLFHSVCKAHADGNKDAAGCALFLARQRCAVDGHFLFLIAKWALGQEDDHDPVREEEEASANEEQDRYNGASWLLRSLFPRRDVPAFINTVYWACEAGLGDVFTLWWVQDRWHSEQAVRHASWGRNAGGMLFWWDWIMPARVYDPAEEWREICRTNGSSSVQAASAAHGHRGRGRPGQAPDPRPSKTRARAEKQHLSGTRKREQKGVNSRRRR